MPRGVRFNDLIQVLDFVYYGEISLSSDDINSFMALAELLQIRGLTDDDQQQQKQQQQLAHDQKFGPRPQDKSVSKRKGGPPSLPTPPPGPGGPGLPVSMKKPKIDPQFQPDVGKDQPDYDDYQAAELEGQEFEHQHHPQPGPVPSTSGGIKLTGLVCPHCRMFYHDVEALKNHMATSHRTPKAKQQQNVVGQFTFL